MSLPFSEEVIQRALNNQPRADGHQISKFNSYDWLMQKRNYRGILAPTIAIPPEPPTPTGTTLIDFSTSTTSGTVDINWGDGFSDTTNSGVSLNHTFFCPTALSITGFWTGIDPCV